jgi:hypothetical protein
MKNTHPYNKLYYKLVNKIDALLQVEHLDEIKRQWGYEAIYPYVVGEIKATIDSAKEEDPFWWED